MDLWILLLYLFNHLYFLFVKTHSHQALKIVVNFILNNQFLVFTVFSFFVMLNYFTEVSNQKKMPPQNPIFMLHDFGLFLFYYFSHHTQYFLTIVTFLCTRKFHNTSQSLCIVVVLQSIIPGFAFADNSNISK